MEKTLRQIYKLIDSLMGKLVPESVVNSLATLHKGIIDAIGEDKEIHLYMGYTGGLSPMYSKDEEDKE